MVIEWNGQKMNCAGRTITRMDDTLEAYDRAVEMALSMFGIKIDIDTERDMRKIFISFQKDQNEREDQNDGGEEIKWRTIKNI